MALKFRKALKSCASACRRAKQSLPVLVSGLVAIGTTVQVLGRARACRKARKQADAEFVEYFNTAMEESSWVRNRIRTTFIYVKKKRNARNQPIRTGAKRKIR
jgi:hypothetical protein